MFCSKCGNEIADQIKFCPNCGQAVNATTNEAASSSNTADFVLTINRAKQWFAVNPAIKIVIDGSAEYKIDNGETLNIPISAGGHNLAFSCNVRNKIVNIQVTGHVTLNIKLNRMTGGIDVK